MPILATILLVEALSAYIKKHAARQYLFTAYHCECYPAQVQIGEGGISHLPLGDCEKTPQGVRYYSLRVSPRI